MSIPWEAIALGAGVLVFAGLGKLWLSERRRRKSAEKAAKVEREVGESASTAEAEERAAVERLESLRRRSSERRERLRREREAKRSEVESTHDVDDLADLFNDTFPGGS